MDALIHLLIPMLILLALRKDPKSVIMFAPLAILPDFDVLTGLHRAPGHSFVPTLILPLILILYARFKKPEWMAGALLTQFYLASHVILDITGGVAFLYPFTTEQIFIDPEITFNMTGGVNFGFHLDWGMRPLREMGTVDFLSDTGFAMIFLGILACAVFRKEMVGAARQVLETAKELLGKLRR
jgi:membrane-bound metal-dependent hydrolase YbcI (DUF457 family)